MSFFQKLQNFLEDAQKESIINSDTKEQLQNFAKNYEKNSSNSSFVTLGFFGAMAIILGLALIIFHNWQQISNFTKIFAYLVSFALLHFTGYLTRTKYPKISRTIFYIAASYILAGIGLIAQIYNLSNKHGEFYFIWFILILPMALILKDEWLGIMTLFAFYLWLNIIANANFYPSIGSEKNQIIYLTTIFANMVLIAKIIKPMNTLKESGYILLILLCLLMGYARYFLSSTIQPIVIHPIIIAIIIINLIGFTYFALKTRQLSEILILGLILTPLIFSEHQKTLIAIFYWIIWFSGCALMIYKGEIERKKNLINIGSWGMMIGLIARFIDLTGTMLFNGSIFILFGIILIAIAFALEKYRQYLIKKI